MLRFGAVTLVVAFTLAGCAGLEDFQVSAPAWHSGNQWTYDVESTFRVEGAGSQFVEGGTEGSTEGLRVLRHGDDVAGEPVYLVAHGVGEEDGDPFDPDVYQRLLAFRATDLASVDVDGPVLWDCTGPDACLDRLGAVDLDAEVDWPFPPLRFPLEDGNSWSVPFDDQGNSLEASVGGSRTVKTGAGTFDAVRVTYRADVVDVEEDETIRLHVDWKVDYSEETRSVVQSRVQITGSVTEAGGFGGERLEVEGSIEYTLREFSLERQDPMDARALWDHFGMERFHQRFLDIHPVGVIRGDGAQVLDLSTRAHDLPSGTQFHWSISEYGAHDPMDRGQGASFYPEVELGGLYVVEAWAQHNGTTLAASQMMIETWLEAQREVACETVSIAVSPVPPQGGCDPVDVMVRAGATQMHVQGTLRGDAVAGHLEILDPTGQTIAQDGLQHELDLSTLPDGVYTLQVVVERGARASAELDIDVRYETPEFFQTGPVQLDE